MLIHILQTHFQLQLIRIPLDGRIFTHPVSVELQLTQMDGSTGKVELYPYLARKTVRYAALPGRSNEVIL